MRRRWLARRARAACPRRSSSRSSASRRTTVAVAGSHRVIDALATLAFDYPRRADFFRGELKQFLLLAREQERVASRDEGVVRRRDGPAAVHAGQLPPLRGRLRQRGRRRSLRQHRAMRSAASPTIWRATAGSAGSRCSLPARIEPEQQDRHPASAGWRPLRAPAGVDVGGADGVTPVAWPGVVGPEPLGCCCSRNRRRRRATGSRCHNFYVITRYNRSRLYATAVWQLAQAIVAR